MKSGRFQLQEIAEILKFVDITFNQALSISSNQAAAS